MTAYVDATRGSIRNQPISPELKNLILTAASTAGVDTVRVISGGQCSKGTCRRRTGSTRHDNGNAADLQLIIGGKTQTFHEAAGLRVFETFAFAAAAEGATGLGAGEHYMGFDTIHVGFGDKSIWGAGGKSVNAPKWLISAVKAGWKGTQLVGSDEAEELFDSDDEEIEEHQTDDASDGCLSEYEISDEDVTTDAELPLVAKTSPSEPPMGFSSSADWLVKVLWDAGLKVAEVDGWQDRGRGPLNIKGVICHHTATQKPGNMPSLKTLINGRLKSDGKRLPGPLAQLGLARDGTYFVVASGRANHAGEGSWRGVSGNVNFLGIEAENSGLPSDPWPDVQMDAYRRGVAAILRHLKIGVNMCAGHKEYAPSRKPDPSFDMDAFRTSVSSLLDG